MSGLQPSVPFSAERRYLDGTNVVETTFATADGVVRVRDLMTRPAARPIAWNEVVRLVECVGGEVALRWRVEPRFDFKGLAADIERTEQGWLMRSQTLNLVLQTWGAGEPAIDSTR